MIFSATEFSTFETFIFRKHFDSEDTKRHQGIIKLRLFIEFSNLHILFE